MKKTFLAFSALAGAGLIATPAVADEGPRISVQIGNGGYGGYYGQPARYDRYDRYDRYNRYDNRRHFAYGKVRELQGRVQQMRQDIRYFGRNGALSNREARRLDNRAVRLQRQIAYLGEKGLTQREYRNGLVGIRNMHNRIRNALNNQRRYQGYGYGYNNDRYYRDDERWANDRRWRGEDRRYRDRDDDDWDD